MSLIDRIFGRTAPEPEPRRTPVPHVRYRSQRRIRYAAAADEAWQGDFRESSGSADYELREALPKVRNKIRALARNSSAMKRCIGLVEQNVVGPSGIRLQVRVRKGDNSPDVTLNSKVEEAWKLFCQTPTVDGQMDMIELQKQMAATWLRDGEYIIEKVRDNSAPDGFLLNPIEADLLDITLNGVYRDTGNQLKMGVEVNAAGKPVAYHFLQDHPGDQNWWMSAAKKKYRRVPADRVIHIFKRTRPGQTRGEPQPTSIVGTAKMLDGYREAEVTGRRVKASAMGLVTEPEDVGNNGIDGLADREREDDGQLEIDMVPGTIISLPPGKDFKQFDPGGVQSDFDAFDGQMKKDISMGVNISPVSLGYETAQLSYSTHRGIIMEDRETYRELQSFFIRMGMNRIFVAWLRSHITFNVESVVMPSRMLAILANFRFNGRGWDQIDPTKDTQAETEQLRNKTTSLSRIAAKRGMDRDELLDEIADDDQALKARGLTQHLGDDKPVETTSSSNNNDGEQDDDPDDG